MTMQVHQEAAIVRDQYDGTEIAVQHETAAAAVAASAKATIEARYIVAMKRPRNMDNVRTLLLRECRRPGFAEAARYRKPVGRKYNEETRQWEAAHVEGLSVRFAEAAMRLMGNLSVEAASLYDDAQKVIVRVSVTDLETNAVVTTDVTVAKTVERKTLKKGQRALRERLNSYGDKVFLVEATDDEVLNRVNALASKAKRNAVLSLLPADIRDECDETCVRVMHDADAKDPDAAKKKLLDAFAGIGVLPGSLAEYLGHDTAQLAPAELAELRATYAAIRDGETTWSAVVDARRDDGAGSATQEAGAIRTRSSEMTDELVAKHAAARAEMKASAAKAGPAPAATREPGED